MSDEINIKTKSKKTKLFIAIAAVVIALLTVSVVIFATSQGATAKKLEKQLSLGAKYLSELDYEQAIVAYELAIEIDPKNVDAYIGLADVYIAMGDYEKAEEIFEEAEAQGIDTELVRKKKEELAKAIAILVPNEDDRENSEDTGKLASINLIATAEVGDEVKFGRFVQDFVQLGLDTEDFTYDEVHCNLFDSHADEIEWYVLDRKDDKVLLLSKYVLDTKPYHKEYTEVTWAQSSMREWLNSIFYNFAFSEEEKKYICKTKLLNNDNIEYGTEGGEVTIDNVFLLSIEEAKEYFNFTYDSESMDGFEEYEKSGLDVRLKGVVTDYAMLNGSSNYLIEEGAEDCSTWWYLRSMGGNNKLPAIVEPWGYISTYGYPSFEVDIPNGVRPAIWVDITGSSGDGSAWDLTEGSEVLQEGENRIYHSLKANPENLLSFDEINFLGHSIADLDIETVQRLFEENNYSVTSNLEWEDASETDYLWLSGNPIQNWRDADITAMQYFEEDYVCLLGYTQYTFMEEKTPVGTRNIKMHDTFGEVLEKLGFVNAYEVESDMEYFFSQDPYEDDGIGSKEWSIFEGMLKFGRWGTEGLRVMQSFGIGSSENEEGRDYNFSFSLEDTLFQKGQGDKRYSLELEFKQDENTNGKFILTRYNVHCTETENTEE